MAPARAPLEVPETAQLLLGRVAADGRYDVLAFEMFTPAEPLLLGSIPDLEARLPDRLGLARHQRAAVSETGFLVVTVGRVVVDEGDFRLAVFDLVSPDAAPWLTGNTQFRVVGDRLWLVDGDDQLEIFDLPNTSPRDLTIPPGRSLVRDDVVPFFLTSAGDAALLQDHETAGPPYSLLGLDGVERPLAGETFAWTTGREQPFGPGRARIRIGINCAEVGATYCIDREVGPDTVVAVDELADAAWVPGFEFAAAHVGTDGLGVVFEAREPELVVRFDRQPVRIAGFWSNLAIVPFGENLALGAVFVGVDALTQLPMGPGSVIPVPGDVLLRTIP